MPKTVQEQPVMEEPGMERVVDVSPEEALRHTREEGVTVGRQGKGREGKAG